MVRASDTAGGAVSIAADTRSPEATARPTDSPETPEPTVLATVAGPAVLAVVALTYAGMSQYVIWLNDPVNAGAGYWPGAGLTLVALLLLPVRRWGWVLAAIAVAELGSGALHGYPVAATGWWTAANIVEPAFAALLLRRLGHSGLLAPLRALVQMLLVGVVLGPLVGAVVGSVGTSTVYDSSYLDVLFRWWAGDGLGVLVVAPVLLCFRHSAVPDRSVLEIAAPAVAAVAITLVSFFSWVEEWDVVLSFMIFPVMMLASVRLGIRGAAIIGLLVAELANLATAIGYGPFRLVGDTNPHAVTVLQVFLGCALTTALVIATLVHDTLDNSRRYQHQRAVADAFQSAVLPERMPTPPGLSLAARYIPAATAGPAALLVGGDWYDAFALPGDSTAFVIGDVTGHDLDAAVVMGQVRNGLRSLVSEMQDPARALAAIDRQMAAADRLTLATAIVAVHSCGRLQWSNAGHLPLLLVPESGPARYLTEGPHPLLGVGGSRYTTYRTDLGVGDVVIAFTDGVIEHRSWRLDDGLAHLARLVAGSPSRDPHALADVLLTEGLDGRSRDDDACIMVIRQGPPPAS